jgi:two-component system, NtrC family, sensor histidine kinase AtoS
LRAGRLPNIGLWKEFSLQACVKLNFEAISMTNAFQSKTSINPLRRSRPPGEGELIAVFQLMGDAALLVDTSRDSVVQATPAFLKLTAYAQNEVLGRPPREFFPDLPEQTLAGEDTFHTLLERRGRPPLAVSVMPRTLDPTGAWRVLLCHPHEDPHHLAIQQMERFQESLSRINLQALPTDSQSAQSSLVKVMEITQNLFEADVAGVYQIDPGGQSFSILAGSGEIGLLPARISISDQMQLSRVNLWKPGRRVQTELHRKARVEGLSYVTSAPLGAHGLLVIAAHQREPAMHQEMTLQVMAERVGSLIRSYEQFGELRARLQEFENELKVWQQAVESAKEGILFLGPDLTVRRMNPAAEWMLGYADREVRNQAVESILIGPERLVPALQDALDGVPTHNMGVVSLHRRDGHSFPAEIQVIPVQNQDVEGDGGSMAVMVGFRDVSANEEIRQRTQQLEQRAVLGEVTAVFAHEVRNPINNISTGLQLLAVKLPPEDPNQDNIARLINDCTRLSHLMESVLNFSRQVEHKFQEVDLEMLLKRILDRWTPRMNNVNVTWFFHYEDNTPHALGDPRSLEQVFTNLISNAVEAMSSRGGSLAVRVMPYHQLPGHPQVEVTVSDDGPGIPDEIREKIFDPFVTTKSQGTGLGLAITKRIVTAHHGFIRLNTFPGGTVFHVLLSAYQGESS